MAADDMIRVLIADDDALMRAGLRSIFEAADGIEVVGEAGDGREAIYLCKFRQPDLVLMDVRMPVMDGVEATRRITADGFATDPDAPVKVLVLTTYHVDDTVVAALRAGASGFMLKDAAPAELLAAVRAVAAGEAWLQPAVARGLLAEFAARPEPRAPERALLDRLTPREQEVLVLIAEGLTNGEIAARLVVGEVTVKTHVGRLLMKLELRDRVHAVIAAYEYGLVVPGVRAAGPNPP